jgi:hypothetical protein
MGGIKVRLGLVRIAYFSFEAVFLQILCHFPEFEQFSANAYAI